MILALVARGYGCPGLRFPLATAVRDGDGEVNGRPGLRLPRVTVSAGHRVLERRSSALLG